MGIGQAELARRAGMPQSTINSLIRRGRRSSPHLLRIARALETTPAYLSGETDDPDSDLPDVTLTSEEQETLDLLRGLAPKDRGAVLQLIRTIATSAPSSMVQFQRQPFKGAAGE